MNRTAQPPAGPSRKAPPPTYKKENIVLIGMPGCGKTTIGRALAARMARPFFDTDLWAEARAGMPVRQIIEAQGEENFRALEEQAVREAAKLSGAVIATGGGTPLREGNRAALKENGIILLLLRDLALLSVEGRPLSVDLAALQAARMPVYEAFCDAALRNEADIQRVAEQAEALIS